jgi:hypothetical protein
MHLTSEVKGILLFLLLLIVIFCSFLVYIIIDEHRCELLCEETQQNYEYSAPFINWPEAACKHHSTERPLLRKRSFTGRSS